MIFLSGWALWLLSLGAVVAVIYFLKRQAPSVEVSALWLWRGAERQPKSALKLRFTQIIPLLLQLTALAALALGISQPVIYTPAGGVRTLAILIDGSASMGARVGPGGPTYYRRAVEEALALLRSNPAAEVTLIQAQAQSVLLSPPSRDHAKLRSLLLGSRPTYQGDASLSGLISLLESQAPQGFERVVFFTNSANYELLRALEGMGWEVRRIGGGGVQDVAAARFGVRPQPEAGGYAIFIELWNSGDKTGRASLKISADGKLVGERLVEIPPRAALPLAIDYEGPPAAKFVARLDPLSRDDWAEDNVRYASPPRLRPWKVLWVGETEFYLERFLGLSSQVDLLIRPAWEEGLAPQQFDLVILHKAKPPGPTAGRFLLVGSELPPWVSLGELRAAPDRKIEVKRDHPLISGLDPGDWRLLRLREAEVDPKGTLLLELDGVPLLYLFEDFGVRLAYLGVDLASSNLGLSVDFPILMHRLLSWLAPRREEETEVEMGEELPLAGLEGPVEIRDPEGRSCRWRESLGCGLLQIPGFYEVAYGGMVQIYAANIPAEESRLSAPLQKSDPTRSASFAEGLHKAGSTEMALLKLWPHLLGLGIFLMALEFLLFDRPLIRLRSRRRRRP